MHAFIQKPHDLHTMPARKILLLNGPNLNLLGTREPHIYGNTTLSDVVIAATTQASASGATLLHFQTNWEGALIDRIQEARTDGTDAIIINPAAFTHYSIALRDALLAVEIPFVEVHVSNIHAREEWRSKSWLSDKAVAVICGLGTFGYRAAVEFCLEHIKEKKIEKL
jgi:3-dehydroquinate dehydratase-2